MATAQQPPPCRGPAHVLRAVSLDSESAAGSRCLHVSKGLLKAPALSGAHFSPGRENSNWASAPTQAVSSEADSQASSALAHAAQSTHGLAAPGPAGILPELQRRPPGR